MGHSHDAYYDTRRRSTSGTALRDQWGNLLPGEFTGVDQFGQGIPMGQRPMEQGLHTGTISTGAPERGPSAFDEKFGKPQAPPTRTIVPPTPAPATPVTAPGAPTGTLPGYTQSIKPGVQPAAQPAPAARAVAAPDAFGARRTNMSGQVERWQPSEATGTGKWIGGAGVAPSQVAMPVNPADRALLMDTRQRDAMAKQPAPISIPGGDPAARAWNTARGTGHASTPEPGAAAVRPPDAFARPILFVANAAGTGRDVATIYGHMRSTNGPATPQALPAGVTASAQTRHDAGPATTPASAPLVPSGPMTPIGTQQPPAAAPAPRPAPAPITEPGSAAMAGQMTRAAIGAAANTAGNELRDVGGQAARDLVAKPALGAMNFVRGFTGQPALPDPFARHQVAPPAQVTPPTSVPAFPFNATPPMPTTVTPGSSLPRTVTVPGVNPPPAASLDPTRSADPFMPDDAVKRRRRMANVA